MGIVYQLDFANGKSYIGITRQPLKARISQHRGLAKRGEQTLLYNAWRAHGAPTVGILAVVDDDILHAAEVKLIKEHATLYPNGLNSTEGGEVSPMLSSLVVSKIVAKKVGYRHSDETKAKLKSARAENLHIIRRSGPLSDETKAKMSESQKGRKHSPETLAKMSIARTVFWQRKKEAGGGI